MSIVKPKNFSYIRGPKGDKGDRGEPGSGVAGVTGRITYNSATKIVGFNESGLATTAYVNSTINNIVSSAPVLLDTLNELSAAIGNNPNFITDISASIATKLSLAGGSLTGPLTLSANPSSGLEATTKQYVDDAINAQMIYSTDDVSEGQTNLYYTTARANTDFDTRLSTKSTTNLTEGTNLYYSNTRARSSISVSGDLSYNSSTGVISYTAPIGFSGNYNDLTNKPNLSTVATSGSYTDLTNKPNLSVYQLSANAFSGSYTDLTNKPVIPNLATVNENILPSEDVTYDLGSPTKQWKSLYLSGSTMYLGGTAFSVDSSGSFYIGGKIVINSSGSAADVDWDDISNKPTFATVSTSGSYNDLTNKPTKLSDFINDLDLDGGEIIFNGEDLGFSNGSGNSSGTGAQGPKGDTGDTGPAGADGAQGPKGDTGDTGPAGADGAQGPKGDTGDTGPAGADGATGPKGDTGEQGLKGDTGDTGPAGADGATGPQGPSGQGLINQTIILNNVAPATNYTAQDVTEWSASYTGTGGQLLVKADITMWSNSTAIKNWYLKKNGTTVATGSFFFNNANVHMTMPTLQYVDTTGSTTAATWSITVGASAIVDAMDRATITVTEYTGINSINVSSLTASGNVSGSVLISTNASGNEGGEIQLAKSPNSTLTGSNVIIDQYTDRVRFFEAGGTTRGAYIDLTQASAGTGTLLNNRVSGFVDAGTFVTMDNIKATVTTSGNRGLSLATVTGSFAAYIGGTFGGVSVGHGGSSGSITVTTTASTSLFGWSFPGAGDISTYIITNTSSLLAYRITLQIGYGYNNNMISIERLI